MCNGRFFKVTRKRDSYGSHKKYIDVYIKTNCSTNIPEDMYYFFMLRE